jgi:hypothetical protein
MIQIRYMLSADEKLGITDIERQLYSVRRACLDMPVSEVSEVATDYYPQDELQQWGEKTYCPLVRVGFQCKFGAGSSELKLILRKFPSEGRCPLYWIYQGEFWTLNDVPDDVFLSRHRAAIKILENLQTQNFTVQVSDEGEYWTKRNLSALLDFKKIMRTVKDPRETIVR